MFLQQIAALLSALTMALAAGLPSVAAAPAALEKVTLAAG